MTMLLGKFSEAQAIAICWMATHRGPLATTYVEGLHDDARCGWCIYPQVEKLKAVEAFELREDAELQRRRFFEAAPSVRRRLIRRAQGYDTPMPLPAAPVEPAATPSDELPQAEPMQVPVAVAADAGPDDEPRKGTYFD